MNSMGCRGEDLALVQECHEKSMTPPFSCPPATFSPSGQVPPSFSSLRGIPFFSGPHSSAATTSTPSFFFSCLLLPLSPPHRDYSVMSIASLSISHSCSPGTRSPHFPFFLSGSSHSRRPPLDTVFPSKAPQPPPRAPAHRNPHGPQLSHLTSIWHLSHQDCFM